MSLSHHVGRVELNETTSLLNKGVNVSVPKKSSNSFLYAIALMSAAGALLFIVANNLPKDDVIEILSTPATSSPADDIKSINLDIDTLSLHVTIVYDQETGSTKLIDNAPVMCRPSILSSHVTCPVGATSDLATADYQLNVGGNGWNYISIDSVDMRKQVIKGPKTTSTNTTPDPKSHPKHGKKVKKEEEDEETDAPAAQPHIEVGELIDRLAESGDVSLVRQLYLRNMHAVGLLEGYLSCREIGYWYANFYDGLFGGGTVNRATMEFLEQNHVWMNQQAALYWEVDDYWLTVRGLMAQLEGLLIGAQNGCPGTPLEENVDDDAHSISDYKGVYMPTMEHGVAMQHLLLMNANGDMFQIMQKYPANLVNNTDFVNRHGDSSIDSTPTVDDYVDDYTIAKAHNITSAPAEDDDEAYAYGTSYGDNTRKLASQDADVTGTTGANLPAFPTDLTDAQILALPNLGSDHCSAMIKILPDFSDVVFGHDTWDEYSTAFPRVFKHIRYNRMKDSLPIHGDMMDIYFSASPGLLASIDDFYIIHGEVANLAVTETSLDMYNAALVDLINPSTMLCWARIVVANRLATSGNSWAQNFQRYHSGTYANQWMVLDFNRFQPFQEPRRGFLTVLEELPGISHYEDLTQILVGKGYWASYNNPYFKEIQVLSGCSAKCQLDSTYCHFSTPRAKIFRARQDTVRTVSDLQALMQYNKYASDVNSKGDSCKAIACRKDLEPVPSRRSPFGAIDAKVSSVNMATRHPAESVTSLRHTGYTRTSAARPEIFVKLGPSTDGMAPFCWSQLGPTTADVTIQAPVPAEPVVEPAQPAQSEKSGEPVQGGHKKAPDKASGGHLRKTPASPAVDGSASASSEDEVEADNDSSADSDEPDTSASSTTTAPVTPVADRATTGTTTTGTTAGTDVTTTSTSTSTGSVAPTAQPTFRQGPRVYVHKGHPECFDFDWETMPPLKKDKK